VKAPVKKVAPKAVSKPASKPVAKKEVKPAAKPVAKAPAKAAPAKAVKEKAVKAPKKAAKVVVPKAPKAPKPSKDELKAEKQKLKEAKKIAKQQAKAAAKAQAKAEKQAQQAAMRPKGQKEEIKIDRSPETIRREIEAAKAISYSIRPTEPRHMELPKQPSLERTKFNEAELNEFKVLINTKLEDARKDYELLKESVSFRSTNGTDDTSPTFKLLEDGSEIMSKEEAQQLAMRQQKFIQNLESALVRIENKTYGICRATGQMISKERLRSVPHATLSIEAKRAQ
jgi:RNA polymerase-binding transcription factor DksA